jgi:hypothetical protein
MPSHANLTGTDLHEPKGAAAASANTVYVATGGGTGAWSKIDADNIDTTSIKNTNKQAVVVYFTDIGTVRTLYVPIPYACTLTAVTTALQAATATTDTILTFANNGGSSMGTVTIAFSGAAAGDVDTLGPVTNNTFTAGQTLRITTDGGTSNAVDAMITLEFTLT